MGGIVKLRYTPILVGAGATVLFKSDTIGGFLFTTAGLITVVRNNDDGTTTTLFAFTAPAVGWYDLPFYVGKNGGSITSGAAVGVLGV